jgi:hypothetical protein
MACSSRKIRTSTRVAAIERYDGVAFRVVKRLQRIGRFPEDVDLIILSAKHGLISQDEPIQDYDVRMTASLARQQVEQNHAFLRKLIRNSGYREVFISAGQAYVPALQPFQAWKKRIPVTLNRGRIGIQLKTLKNWLSAPG